MPFFRAGSGFGFLIEKARACLKLPLTGIPFPQQSRADEFLIERLSPDSTRVQQRFLRIGANGLGRRIGRTHRAQG